MGFRQKILKWAKYRHHAAQYPGEFDITEDDLDWPTHCPALGIELVYASNKLARTNTASIDRKDSRLGYIKGNVQILSLKANRMKNNATPEEVMRLAIFLQKDLAILS